MPSEFKEKITVLDLKKCRLTRLSQLNKLKAWAALRIVDVRDQLGYFVCDIQPDFHFELFSDCSKVTQTPEMTTFEENDTYIEFETTQIMDYETTSVSSKNDMSTVFSTTMKKPPRRYFPKPNSTSPRTKRPLLSSTMPHATEDVTQPAKRIKSTPYMDVNKAKNGTLHMIFIIFTIVFAVILISSLVLIILHIYGGICTCMKRIRAIICMCTRCNKNNKDNDKDSDQGDKFSITSTTLFDVTEMNEITVLPPSPLPKIDTLRPRFHDKEA